MDLEKYIVKARLGVLGGKRQRQERIVVDLGGPAAVVAAPFQRHRRVDHGMKLAEHAAVDLEAGAGTHARRRYSKQFSMVNVITPVRRSPIDDGNCA